MPPKTKTSDLRALWKNKLCVFVDNFLFVQGPYAAYLRTAVPGGLSSFPDTKFHNLPVVQDFLMPFMIGLFIPVFTQRVRPFMDH